MAAMAKVDGQEKVLAVVQHIVKSLATSKNAAKDMIRILSGFDNRLSIMNNDLFPPAPDKSPSATSGDAGDAGDAEPSMAEARIDATEKVLFHWDPSCCDSLLWEAPSEEIADFLSAVDEVISFVAGPQASPLASGSSDLRCHAENALQIAMFRLEEEFRYLMIQNTIPLNADGLYGSICYLSLSFASDSGDNAGVSSKTGGLDQQKVRLWSCSVSPSPCPPTAPLPPLSFSAPSLILSPPLSSPSRRLGPPTTGFSLEIGEAPSGSRRSMLPCSLLSGTSATTWQLV